MIDIKNLSDADLEILWHDIEAERQRRNKEFESIWLEYEEGFGSGKCWIAKIGYNQRIDEFLKTQSWDKNGIKGRKLFDVPLVEGAVYKFNYKGYRGKDKTEIYKVVNKTLEKQ